MQFDVSRIVMCRCGIFYQWKIQFCVEKLNIFLNASFETSKLVFHKWKKKQTTHHHNPNKPTL